MDYKQKFAMLSYLTGTNVDDYARAIGASVANFSTKCLRGKFTTAQLRTIAKIAGVQYVARLINKNGQVIEGDNLNEMLKKAINGDRIAWQRMCMVIIQNSGKDVGANFKTISNDTVKSVISKYNHHHYIQSVERRLTTDKLTDDERKEFAKTVGCKYEGYFLLNDGKNI